MLPQRFVESGCLKCHHQVTDLIRDGSKVEAPKLLRGYNLVRENGCFGCHEIAGIKGGRPVGPDLRLEPRPPLDDLTAGRAGQAAGRPGQPARHACARSARACAASARRPTRNGSRKWIKSPRGFRPDTKMPHFYGLSNNNVPTAAAATEPEEVPRRRDQLHRPLPVRREPGLPATGTDQASARPTRPAEGAGRSAKHAGRSDKQNTEIGRSCSAGWSMARCRRRWPSSRRDSCRRRQGRARPRTSSSSTAAHLFTERGCLACHIARRAPPRAAGDGLPADRQRGALRPEPEPPRRQARHQGRRRRRPRAAGWSSGSSTRPSTTRGRACRSRT